MPKRTHPSLIGHLAKIVIRELVYTYRSILIVKIRPLIAKLELSKGGDGQVKFRPGEVQVNFKISKVLFII